MHKLLTAFTAIATFGGASSLSNPADACGGCFHPVTESTVVTGHRMAVSISKTQAVLWDQIRYAGDPAEFSWVLPIKKGAFVEVSSDAFFEALETGTVTTVQAPDEGCAPRRDGGDIGCSSSLAAPQSADFEGSAGGGAYNGVQVVHEGTVGPYDTVTLSAENPNALAEWLDDNGYVLPDSVKPIVDAYVAEDFDFIALKLSPNQGVSAMKPVRVVTPGSNYTLPLRMVAAGVGESVDIVLYVIGEGRYETAAFDNGVIQPKLVTWDFKTDRSDYAEQRLGLLEANGGRSWLTSYAKKNALLGQVADPLSGGFIGYNVGSDFRFADTIAAAYLLQGFENEEIEPGVDQQACLEDLAKAGGSGVVKNLCDAEGACAPAGAGEIDAELLACGSLDDIAVALEGMHPADVVLTRLEANLPVAALDQDLRLSASDDQGEVESRFAAELKVNPCWDQQPSAVPLDGRPRHRIPPEALVLVTLGAAGIALATRRRRAASTSSAR